MLKKIKDFDTKYSGMFFAFSLMIIVVFLVYLSTSNREKEKNCVVPSEIVNNYSNYTYDIEYKKDDRKVKLYVKRYDTKYLIEKDENGIKNTYYLNYTDLLEKSSDGKFIKYRSDEIVEGLDNKYLIFDYINDISMKSSVNNKDGLTCYINRKLELTMCISLDNSVEVKTNDFNIVYTIDNVGKVEDFDVEISKEIDITDNNIITE